MLIRKRLPVLLFFVCSAAPFWTSAAVAQETLRYAIVSNGKTRGSEVDVFSSDGRIDSTFEYSDRWRGPKISGIPPAKALQIATFKAAGLLKQRKDLGSIGPGKLSDLVLVEGNPAEKISDIRRCRLVAKNGVLFKSDAVYAAVGIKPAD